MLFYNRNIPATGIVLYGVHQGVITVNAIQSAVTGIEINIIFTNNTPNVVTIDFNWN